MSNLRNVSAASSGKGSKIMAIADAGGFPVAAHIESTSPHEMKLVEETIESGFTEYVPNRLIGDKAYDSDGLDERHFDELEIEMIAPRRKGRRKPCTKDGKKLRRYKRQWPSTPVCIASNYRRLVVRYEYHAENFLGLVHLELLNLPAQIILRYALIVKFN